VVTGYGTHRRPQVFVFAQDFTVFGGSLSGAYAAKICKVMDLAMKIGAPVIGLNDSGGARIQEGVESLAGYADIFLRNTLASGVVPQISAIMGPCAGGAVYSPAITDFILMVEGTSYMFITGPDVIKTVTHEEVTKEALGGAPRTPEERRGALHRARRRARASLVRELLSYLPSNNAEDPPSSATADRPAPRGARHAGAGRPEQAVRHAEVIKAVVDDGTSSRCTSTTRRTSWCRLRAPRRPAGRHRRQPAACWPACLDIDASIKAARFVRFCDCFNIPLVTFEDVPGFLPGTDQEYGGIITHGAKLLYAFAEATVPKLTVITRKAYGGAYDVMAQAHPRRREPRLPHRRDRGDGPRGRGEHRLPQGDRRAPPIPKAREAAGRRLPEKFANPYKAAELGYIDEVIDPRDTRQAPDPRARDAEGQARIENPPRKHGNIPLSAAWGTRRCTGSRRSTSRGARAPRPPRGSACSFGSTRRSCRGSTAATGSCT
jgi:propionyl-CoA carboxylase beta chain